MVLCSPDWGAHGGNEYWRTPLDKLTLTSIQLPDDAVYLLLGRKMPIGKPGWGSMLSVVDGGLAPVPWEDLDPAMVQEIQCKSSGFTLDVLKNELRPRDAVETTPGGDETSCLVRFSCNLYFRFFQCKILIYVHPQKTTIPALFWTVLVSVDQEFLWFHIDGVFTVFCTIKLGLGRRRPVLRSRAPIQKMSISEDFK